MKLVQKSGALMLCLCLLALLLAGCSRNRNVPIENNEKAVYTSFYPLYALTEPLLEGVDGVHANCLVQPQDGCLRDYSLSDWDLALAASADIIILGGCGLERFENVLYSLGETGPTVGNVLHEMELMQIRAINTLDDSGSHWLDTNPHIYMSIDGAAGIADRIAQLLCTWDAENESIYLSNLKTMKDRLNSLKEEIVSQLHTEETTGVIVLNEALVYLARDFGLDISVCYDRESGEDLSASDLERCIQILSTSPTKLVLIEKQAPENLCMALSEAGFIPAKMDILSTGRQEQGFEGYIAAMQENALAVKRALSEP